MRLPVVRYSYRAEPLPESGFRDLSGEMRRIHSELAPDDTPGEYRTGYVELGEFIPCAPESIQQCMDELNQAAGAHPWMLFFQILTIHPFNNGNRRVASQLLGIDVKAYQTDHAEHYLSALHKARFEGSFGDWMDICQGVKLSPG